MNMTGAEVAALTDFNPRSPCGERLAFVSFGISPSRISIHAPRVGSDTLASRLLWMATKISIHAPRVGSDARGF